LKLLLLLFLVFNFTLLADENRYSFRAGYGMASENDLNEIVSGSLGKTSKYLRVYFIDGGYLLKKNLFDLPLDLYAKGGLAYFNEDTFSDTMETTLYVKLYLNMDFFSNRLRLGFGEGASYTSNILYVEKQEAESKQDNNSKILNYIDVSLDFDFGRLIRYEALYDTHFGWALKHRSGIFGLINNVEHGGSNYNTLYIEKKF